MAGLRAGAYHTGATWDGRPRRSRLVPVVAVLSVMALVSGCATDAQSDPSAADATASATDGVGDVEALLEGLGAERVYAMAGPDVMRAGFGVLTAEGLRPMQLTPDPAMVSNISGNGADVVIGAAVPPDDDPGGFLLDGAYLLVGDRLKTLARPGTDKFGPTIASDGMIGAISADGGFWTRPLDGSWSRDRRLRNVETSELQWSPSGAAYALTRPGTSRTELVRIGRERAGVKRLGRVPCAIGLLASPAGDRVVARPWSSRKSRLSGCVRAKVLNVKGRVIAKLPKGWKPLAWSADSRQILVRRRSVLALWSKSGGLVNEVEVAAPIWQAAPIYAQEPAEHG